MNVRFGYRTALCRGAIVLLLVPVAQGQAAGQDRPTFPREQFDALFMRVNNAGRWGEQDQRGTLNLITPDVRKNAAGEVRDGISISRSRVYAPGPIPFVMEPMQIDFMRVKDSMLGPSDDSVHWTAERLTLVFHGAAFTHVDAPSHMSYRGRLYNAAVDEPGADGGPLRHTVGQMQEGIVTRGVLMDLARLRGVPYLEPGSIVTVDDFERWERQTGVRVRSGDVLLIRLGHWARHATARTTPDDPRAPGIHPSAARWLHERGVAALGADTNDPIPSLVPGVNAPLHALALVAMGMPLFDSMDLEELGRQAAARSRWTFLFMAAPLNIRNATGSPLNPLAVF